MVTPIAISRFSLHLIISSEKPKEWVLSVVYNPQNIQLQKALWQDLRFFSKLSLPWILLGDFNAILNPTEHRGGNFDHYSAKAKLFSDFINENQLFDLGFIGSPFTWCNNQIGLARRWARLDRVLANNEWLSSFDSYFNRHLSRTASDHSPMLVIAKSNSNHKRRVFRFENFWFDYEQCHSNV
ncbi:hypothetical protein J5N97_022740 [Dioscorea zingiberensis]|uniref:Endonuclease/exonuclease/phosphatase domain-containing protein n=1 Tax=Dioscorea zingiberensis TaxID=325984 RepID=A0A9D5CBT0_9LILI|nr:hypothetical protein J5N97_022740 [Dioscorea zingiberensis]